MHELILVVDDEPKIVRLARDYLEQGSFRVLPVYDGLSALAAARQEKPDLIVLDLNLPGMDGIDVARTLRRESSVPIIMLVGAVAAGLYFAIGSLWLGPGGSAFFTALGVGLLDDRDEDAEVGVAAFRAVEVGDGAGEKLGVAPDLPVDDFVFVLHTSPCACTVSPT